MPQYQLYRMDPVTGHIQDIERFHAGDHVAAAHDVQHRRFDVPVELWHEGRKIIRLDHMPSIFERFMCERE
jgi:hypothetical protein